MTTAPPRRARTAPPALAETAPPGSDKPAASTRRARTPRTPVSADARPAVPATVAAEHPEVPAKKRKRLAKAFSRPLDKMRKKEAWVRDRFTLPKSEYEQLAVLKKRLSERGFAVKKSELVRAGLRMISWLDDEALHAAIAELPPPV